MIARTCAAAFKLSSVEKRLCRLALRVLEYDKRLGPDGFECFNQDYLALRLALEKYFGAKAVDLGDLFTGAWVGDDAGRVRVALYGESLGSTFPLAQRYPSTHQDLELGPVYRNAPGAPFDLVCILPIEEGGDAVMIAYECRHTRRLASKAVKVDVAEISAAVAKVEKACSRDMRPLVLVYTSNRSLSSEVNILSQGMLLEALQAGGPLSHAIVIVRQNCMDYFGPSLAMRFMGYIEPWDVSRSE